MEHYTRRLEFTPNSTPVADDTKFVTIWDSQQPRIYAVNNGTAAITLVITYLDVDVDEAYVTAHPTLLRTYDTIAALAAGAVGVSRGPTEIQDGEVIPHKLRIVATTADVSDQPIDVFVSTNRRAR